MDGAELITPTPTPTPTPTSPAMMSSTMHHVSRPTLGFPLGTALLLIIIFCLSGVFSCCYHWDKLRSLRQRRRRSNSNSTTQLPTTATPTAAPRQHQPDTSIPLYPSKLTFQQQNLKQEGEQSLPVIMPGDRYPKFMAWPCPCPCPCKLPTTVIAVEVVLVPSHSSPSLSPAPAPAPAPAPTHTTL